MKRERRSEAGLTLVEVMVSVVILSMITGALASVFVTALKGSRPTNERIRESNDAQLIAAYLVRDAQSAGGTNPNFGRLDSDLGVSAPSVAPDCTGPAGAVIARFTWRDRSSLVNAPVHAANYYFDASQHQVIRKTCVDGAPESILTLGGSVESILPNGLAQCITGATTTDCPSTPAATLPDFVDLSVRATNDPQNSLTAYSYKLRASLRPEGQNAPDSSTSTLTPLIALGGTCGDGVTGIQAQGGGSSTVTVYGASQVNGGCPAVDFQGSIDFISTGGISVLAPGTCQGTSSPCSTYSTPIGDPFAALPAPNANCTSGSHSAPSGNTYFPGTYTSAVSVGNATFSPGIYVFCQGLTTSGTVTANGVLFYFTGGTLTVSGGNFSASAMSSGMYGSGSDGANIVVWQKSGDNTSLSVCCSNNTIATFAGTIYAPSAIVTLHNGNIQVTSIVAKGVSWEGGGNGGTIIGTPPANPLAMTGPASLQGWTVNRPYPSVTATASGGSGGNIWTATGLPAGMNFSTSGVLDGTPTAAGNYSVTLTVTDSIGETDSTTYVLRINAVPTITNPPNLPNWTINRDYPGTAIVVSGGTAPYSWSATGLPPGLSMNSFGVVIGTPNTLGTYSSINVTVVDVTGVSASRTYSITINPPPLITGPASLPTNITATTPYPATTVTGTSGTTPYSWSASGLPPGLTIGAASGTISGTPNTAGNYNVTVTLRDAAGASDTRTYPVTIKAAPGIVPTTCPVGEINRPYATCTLQPTGTGSPPYTWSATGLPAGLTIGANTATISGTPTVSGTFANVVVTITDSQGAKGNRTITIAIAAAPTINGPATLRNWTINRDYPQTQMTVTGGVSPFTWSQTGLPAGMSMNVGGLITGTPSGPVGTTTVNVTVIDSLGGTATRTYTMTINPTPAINETSIPDGERTVPYSTTLTGNSGTLPYNWAASGLPAGLSINAASGVLSGTPSVSGSFDITFTVTDVAGASKSKILTLNLLPAPAIGASTLPDWTVGVPYPNTTLSATGGQAPYTWSASNLPAGLTIGASTGTVSGTPTTAGTKTVTVTVTDALGGFQTQTYVVKISAAPVITTGSIPSWTVNRPYTSFTMTASGGTQPLNWSATGLPTGLSMNSAGVITGTPTDLGPFSVSVTVLDSVGVTDTRNYTVNINSDPSITTTTLPDGEQNVAYSANVAGSSGTAPYSWSATGLPAGLTISTGGTISGTPTVIGTFTVTLSLTDAAGASAPTQSVTITLYPELLITAPASLPTWTRNLPYPSTGITATGGTGAGTYSWSATGLPTGMSISSGGTISGTPTVSGSFSVTVTVTDSASPSRSKSRIYPLTINPAVTITSATSCTTKKNVDFQMTATGGTGTRTWSATGIPASLTLSTTGRLTGSNQTTNSSFTVVVTDSIGASATITFQVIVVGSGGATC